MDKDERKNLMRHLMVALTHYHDALQAVAKDDLEVQAELLREIADVTNWVSRVHKDDVRLPPSPMMSPIERERVRLKANRCYWDETDVHLTVGEVKIVTLLVLNTGEYMTYREIYDVLRGENFVAGTGERGFHVNVRSAIRRIREKFKGIDPAFDMIGTYTAYGYCWRKQCQLRK